MNAREWPPIGCGSENNPLTNSVYSVGQYEAGGSPLPPGQNGLLMTTGDFVLLTGGGVFLLAG